MATPFTEDQKQKWREKIKNQRQSGLSAEGWCRENGIAPHRFHYWKKKLFPDKANPLSSSSFIELTDSNKCKLSLKYQDVYLQLESASLKQALSILEKLACS